MERFGWQSFNSVHRHSGTVQRRPCFSQRRQQQWTGWARRPFIPFSYCILDLGPILFWNNGIFCLFFYYYLVSCWFSVFFLHMCNSAVFCEGFALRKCLYSLNRFVFLCVLCSKNSFKNCSCGWLSFSGSLWGGAGGAGGEGQRGQRERGRGGQGERMTGHFERQWKNEWENKKQHKSFQTTVQ